MRMPVWIERRARLTPDSLALVAGGERLTWGALAGRARGLAAALLRAGVRPGDTVAALLEASSRHVELVHATSLRGATWMPLNTRWTGRELAEPLRESGARWLIHGAGSLAERAQAAGPEAPAAARLDASALGSRPERTPPAEYPGLQLASCAALVHTSGTSDRPKGVELTAGNLLWSATSSAMHLGALPEDRWLLCVPLFHVAGLSILARAVLFGAAVVLHERFDADRALETLESEVITLVSLVPTMLARLLDQAGARRAPSALRCVLLGGGPIPAALLERAWAQGWPATPTYGLTETAAQAATLPLPEIGRSTGAKPLFATEIAITDAQGAPRPPGEPGEIRVRGPTVMAGYRDRPEATARVLDPDGWLHTGDEGLLDADGFLHVLDRRTDLIVSGGENVAPSEVEAVLRRHGDVADAGVAAEPDPALGQRVAAWVVRRSGARLDEATLQAFCRDHLAGYKIPRRVHFVEALPRTASGKLLRRVLREDPQVLASGA